MTTEAKLLKFHAPAARPREALSPEPQFEPQPEPQIAALLAAFRAHPRFLLTSHARPAGAAIGSTLALAEVLDQLGRKVDIILADPIPTTYRALPNQDRIHHTPSANDIDPDQNAPAILLECDGIARTGLLGLEGRTLINIDHHASGRTFASINWIDEHACAVAAMVYRIAVAAKVDITPSMATCLYAAILSDTGSFTYSSTTADTFALVRHLSTRSRRCQSVPSEHPQQRKARCSPDRRALRRWRASQRQRLHHRRPSRRGHRAHPHSAPVRTLIALSRSA